MLRYSLDHVMNFNFSNNRISDLSELDYLSDLTLRELVFIGNPIALQPTYRMEVARRFPDLQILDSKPIGPEDFPPSPIPPLRPNFCDAQERQQFAYKFLQKYLVAFDSERSSIINAYTLESRFSTTFVTDKGSNTRGTTKTYQRSSRNLKKTKNVQKNISLLFHGADQINNYFKLFPTTSHHLTSSTIDTFLAPGSNSLIIIVHGHYLEKLFNTKRSYDRTFILAAATPGSEAAKNGWEATILNEQLHIRSYLRFPRLEPQPNATPVAQAPTEINQEALVNQFSAATKLKPEFARECLSNNAWDYNQAYEVFQKLLTQGSIPETMYHHH
ncbi:hypothetical protein DLAC_00886 [Tieghemostelium lacteum]|uniref:Uncharacterized protein n=1 Tax=Tieghemostelium lacteum TaxID=361077 RepID=A0A152A7I0_TIELA|nr:hypothetical protein DLAC_00886 [Tieghemostelium lacteum]|eukprot:KYR02085.1 hypothetical protein DLAC_00886 [Tieghemostelium lacteum]